MREAQHSALAGHTALVHVTIGVARTIVITIRPRGALRITGIIWSDPEQSLNAADYTAYGSPNDSADGTRGVHADSTAVGDAVGNALCLGYQGQRKRCHGDGCSQNMELHATPLTV